MSEVDGSDLSSSDEEDLGLVGRAQRVVDEVDNVLLSVHSKGRLYVAILGASNLGDGNYFVSVKFENASYLTTIRVGPTTEWNEEFSFLVMDLDACLEIELHEMEKKKKKKNEIVIGNFSICSRDTKEGEVVREVLSVSPTRKGKGSEDDKEGLLFFRVVYEGDRSFGRYLPLESLLMRKGFHILHSLCEVVELEDAAWLSPAVVAVLVWNQKVLPFFEMALENEVKNTRAEGLLFRGQNLTIKVLSLFALQVGRAYLVDLLQPFFLDIESEQQEDGTFPQDFELDPKRIKGKETSKNLPYLLKWVTKLLDSIFQSVNKIDSALLHLCVHLRKCVEVHFPNGLSSVLSGFFFLRFVCPVVVTPETLPGLRTDPPSEKMRRLLVLVTKIIQNVASMVEFGDKEGFMRCCNPYIRDMTKRVNAFYEQISASENTERLVQIPAIPAQRHSYHLLHVAISSYNIYEILPSTQVRLKSLLQFELNKLGKPEKDQRPVDLLGFVDLEKISEKLRAPHTGISKFNLHSDKKRKKEGSFSAFDLIDWLCVNVPICNSRGEAVSLGNMLLGFQFISPLSSDVLFFSDEDVLFEFSQAVSLCSSGKVALNMRKTITKKDVFGKVADGSMRGGCSLRSGDTTTTTTTSSLRAPTSCPIELASELLETITRILHSLSSLVEYEIRPAMLTNIRDFAKFKVFSLTTCYLQVIDLFQLKTDDEKTSFWLNIYHTLMLHAHADLGAPSSSGSLSKLLTTASYNIGGHLFSLNEIEHCILRASLPVPKSANTLPGGASTRFGKKDPRSRLAVCKSNPYVSFGVDCGSASSGLIDHYLPINVERRLKENTEILLNTTVAIEKEKGVVKVFVPKIVKWFGQDYGKDKYEQLRFIVRHLDESTPGLDDLKTALRPYDNKLKIVVEALPYDPIFLCDLSQVVTRFGTIFPQARSNLSSYGDNPSFTATSSEDIFPVLPSANSPELKRPSRTSREEVHSGLKDKNSGPQTRSPKTRTSRKRRSGVSAEESSVSDLKRQHHEEQELLYEEIRRLKEEISVLKGKTQSPTRTASPLSSTPPSPFSLSQEGIPSSSVKAEGDGFENETVKEEKKEEKVKEKVKDEKGKGEKGRQSLSFKNAEINEKIGDGGSGCVVHVCQVDGWQCALKVLSVEGVSTNQIAQFEKEVLFLESLPPHRNLVQYLYHERTRGSIRLYMRRYHSTLRRFIQSCPEPLSRKEVITICLDVAVGLSILHKNKIVHRDLKTDNLFVTLDGMGSFHYCSVGDLDSAKKLTAGVKAKTIVGTPGYMAPEIYSPDYSYPVDVWSFGVIIYEIFIHGRDEAEEWPMYRVQEKLKHGFPYPIDPEFVDIARVIQRCLKRTPKKRPTVDGLKREFLEMSVSYLG